MLVFFHRRRTGSEFALRQMVSGYPIEVQPRLSCCMGCSFHFAVDPCYYVASGLCPKETALDLYNIQ